MRVGLTGSIDLMHGNAKSYRNDVQINAQSQSNCDSRHAGGYKYRRQSKQGIGGNSRLSAQKAIGCARSSAFIV